MQTLLCTFKMQSSTTGMGRGGGNSGGWRGGRGGRRLGRDRTHDQRHPAKVAEEDVSFTVQVPFDIVEGMNCRAMYYEDEAFYDARIVRRSRTGWYVTFVGYEGDEQDTEVSDILSVPAGHGAPSSSPMPNPTAARTAAQGPKSHPANLPAYHVPAAVQPEQQQQQQWPKKCRMNRRCTIPNCVYGHPQGREMDEAQWDACEAKCYADGLWYEAFRGPRTASGGVLVAFVGYEDDPCQDTLETDVRASLPGNKGKKKRAQKDKYADVPASDQAAHTTETEWTGAGGGRGDKRQGTKDHTHDTASKKIHDDASKREDVDFTSFPDNCVASVTLEDSQAILHKPALWHFMTDTFGITPKGIKIDKSLAKPNEGGQQQPSNRAYVYFGSPEESALFVNKGDGMCLKGKKMSVRSMSNAASGSKTANTAATLNGNKSNKDPQSKAHKENNNKASKDRPKNQKSNTAKEGFGRADTQVAAAEGHNEPVQIGMGSLYKAIMSGASMLDDAEPAAADPRSLAHDTVFGLNVNVPGKAVLQVLDQAGKTVKLGTSALQHLRAEEALVAISVPTGSDFCVREKLKGEVMAALPHLPPDRIFIFDDMVAGAVEFVDGWYSNIYESNPLRLVLVRVGTHNLQLGLANIAPNSVDVVTVFETDCCGEEQLVNDVAQSLAGRIQDKVKGVYGFEPEQWWTAGHSELNALARQVIHDVGACGESQRAYAYCPPGRDAAYMVDIRVGIECVEGAALAAARKFGEVLRESSQATQQETSHMSAIAPLGPSVCGNVIARSLQGTLSVAPDRMHYFLSDARNLAAGAARAAQWISNKSSGKRVVRRCLHNYSCNVLAGDNSDGVTYTGIPWVSLGRELPVQCTVNDLVNVKQLEIKGTNSRTLATVSLAGCVEFEVTIGEDGLLNVACFSRDNPVSVRPEFSPQSWSNATTAGLSMSKSANDDAEELSTLLKQMHDAVLA